MALTKLVLLPDNSSYSVTDGKEVISTQLDGGAARYRRDILGATSTVGVSFVLGPAEYKYLRAFYRTVTVSGSTPFLIDLILDEPTLTEHKAYFIPGSMQLTGQKGLTYTVSAQLEVYPIALDLDYDNSIVMLFSNYGDDWQGVFNAFEKLTNIDLVTP